MDELTIWKDRCERFKKLFWRYKNTLLDNGRYLDYYLTPNDIRFLYNQEEVRDTPAFLNQNLNIPSNIKTCIIYSPDIEKAKSQLYRIHNEKKAKGIRVIEREWDSITRHRKSGTFSDGEKWTIITRLKQFDGIKWDKCLVDRNAKCSDIYDYVLPHAADEVESIFECF